MSCYVGDVVQAVLRNKKERLMDDKALLGNRRMITPEISFGLRVFLIT